MAGKSQPVVKFNHASHQGRDTDCMTCHHMGVGNGSCNGCHEKRGVASASDCNFCHVPATTTTTTDSWGDRRQRR